MTDNDQKPSRTPSRDQVEKVAALLGAGATAGTALAAVAVAAGAGVVPVAVAAIAASTVITQGIAVFVRKRQQEQQESGVLKNVVAEWTMQLGAAVRGGGDDQSWLVPMDSEAVFAQLVGRPRRGLEAWPELNVSKRGEVLAVSLWLPDHTPTGTQVTAVVEGGLAPVRVALTVSENSDEGAVELVGVGTVPGLPDRPRIILQATSDEH